MIPQRITKRPSIEDQPAESSQNKRQSSILQRNQLPAEPRSGAITLDGLESLEYLNLSEDTQIQEIKFPKDLADMLLLMDMMETVNIGDSESSLKSKSYFIFLFNV